MAKKVATRSVARKMKDKWKAKEWYQLYAPNMFNSAPIGETLSDEPDKVMARVTEVNMHELTGDFSKMHIKMKFKVGDVSGKKAHTYFMGHTFTSDYIRRLTRRKFAKTDVVVDVHTKDDYFIRVKPMAVTDKMIQGSQRTELRHIMGRITLAEGSKMTLSELVKSMIDGELARRIGKDCKVIYPVKKIEIRKSEIRTVPEGVKEQLVHYEPPVEEQPSAAEEQPGEAPAGEAGEGAPAEGEPAPEGEATPEEPEEEAPEEAEQPPEGQ